MKTLSYHNHRRPSVAIMHRLGMLRQRISRALGRVYVSQRRQDAALLADLEHARANYGANYGLMSADDARAHLKKRLHDLESA